MVLYALALLLPGVGALVGTGRQSTSWDSQPVNARGGSRGTRDNFVIDPRGGGWKQQDQRRGQGNGWNKPSGNGWNTKQDWANSKQDWTSGSRVNSQYSNTQSQGGAAARGKHRVIDPRGGWKQQTDWSSGWSVTSKGLGTKCRYSITNEKVEQSFGRDTRDSNFRSVSVGSASYLALLADGELKYRNIPLELHNKLESFADEEVQFVTLGPDSKSYYVLFRDGSSAWSGSHCDPDLTRKLKAAKSPVTTMTFAPDGGYFVRFRDGDWEFKNLPHSLAQFLKSNGPRIPFVSSMSVSNDGWFVNFNDGVQMRNIASQALRETVEDHEIDGEQVRSIDFGAQGNWILHYQ